MGLASRPETTLHACTEIDEDRITPSTEDETGDRKTQSGVPLWKREIILLASNFIWKHADAVLREVLKAWEWKVGGSNTEHITKSWLNFLVTLVDGEASRELIRKCVKDGLCLFKVFDTWLESNRSLVERSTVVPSDVYLMRKCRLVEVAHWEAVEAVAEAG